MHVSHLQLADYRSYEAAYLELEPGVSTFIGPNGQGKTNLVEAIGYVATHSSHRVAHDAPLVRRGAQRAVIRAAVVRHGQTALIELEINPGRANRARLNRSPNTRMRDVLGILHTVLFAPEDLALVKGDPGERRRFLDELLTARAPRYAGVRSDYERVLKQRNALLKSAAAQNLHHRGGRDLPTLDVWDEHLAQIGAELLAARLALVAELQPLAAKAYGELTATQDPISLRYRCSATDEELDTTNRPQLVEILRAALLRARPDELRRGVSLVGPHRDDLQLWLNDLPAKASPGRTPSRCGSPASNCSAPTATTPSSSSTTFSRNSTLSGGAASPLTSAPRNKSSSPLPYPTMSPKNSPGHDSGSQEGAWNVNGEHPAPERTDSPQTAENITPPTPLRGVELARQALAKARAEAKARGAAPQGQDRKPQRSLVRSRGEPQQFGDAIRAWLIEHGWQEQVAIGGIFGRWSRIVGERLAEHVRPCSYADGELVVAVDSPAWATQIRAMAPQLVRKLNEELGHGAVRVIKVNGPGGYRTSRGQWRVR